MRDDDIAKLRALCEAATPGPWKLSYPNSVHLSPSNGYLSGADGADVIDADYDGPIISADDAAFITTARTALPAALNEIERLREAVRQMRGDWHSISCDHWVGGPCNAECEDPGPGNNLRQPQQRDPGGDQ